MITAALRWLLMLVADLTVFVLAWLLAPILPAFAIGKDHLRSLLKQRPVLLHFWGQKVARINRLRQPLSKRFMRNANFPSPIADRICLLSDCDEAGGSSVGGLHHSCSPSTVIPEITLIILFSIYGFAKTSRPHISKESLKAAYPLRANSYSSTAVFWKIFAGRVKAPVLHSLPTFVFWRKAAAVFSSYFCVVAPARNDAPAPQRCALLDDERPAIALAQPLSRTVLVVGNTPNYCKSVVPVPGFIFQH